MSAESARSRGSPWRTRRRSPPGETSCTSCSASCSSASARPKQVGAQRERAHVRAAVGDSREGRVGLLGAGGAAAERQILEPRAVGGDGLNPAVGVVVDTVEPQLGQLRASAPNRVEAAPIDPPHVEERERAQLAAVDSERLERGVGEAT
eukprot:4499437-Pleurochrysis_carterae.AAC.2